MKFAKPVRTKQAKKANSDSNTYTTRVDTTVTVLTRQKYDEYNQQNPTNKITWAESIRRGFYSLLREKEGTVMDDLAMGRATYIPLQVKERISRLVKKVQEMAQELSILQGNVPVLPIKGGVLPGKGEELTKKGKKK